MSSFVVLRTDSSSSTTEIRLLGIVNSRLDSTYACWKKESIGLWWTCMHRKGDADNPFVYDALSGRLLISSIIHEFSRCIHAAVQVARSPVFHFWQSGIVCLAPNFAAGQRNWPRLRLCPDVSDPLLGGEGSRHSTVVVLMPVCPNVDDQRDLRQRSETAST